MNYLEHVTIGVGTAATGLWIASAFGLPWLETETLLIGAGVIALGSISVDIDHPSSFISLGIPKRVISASLPILWLLAAALLFYLMGVEDSVLGDMRSWLSIPFVRWALVWATAALGLMIVSRVIAGSLGHRGPLHSIAFTAGVTVVAIVVAMYLSGEWWWGLSFGWGWLLHILADATTEWGVPIWWPISRERVHILFPLVEGAGYVMLVIAGMVLLATAGRLIVWF